MARQPEMVYRNQVLANIKMLEERQAANYDSGRARKLKAFKYLLGRLGDREKAEFPASVITTFEKKLTN